MTRYLDQIDDDTESDAEDDEPAVDGRAPADLVPAAVDRVLAAAEAWLGWDGRAVTSDGNAWTPHKALRRVTDHLIDHLAEIECRLAGRPTVPDQWHGRRLTLDSDWSRFTEADLDEATSRLRRLAACYRARLDALDDATLDARRPDGAWSLRQVVFHVAESSAYADYMAGERP